MALIKALKKINIKRFYIEMKIIVVNNIIFPLVYKLILLIVCIEFFKLDLPLVQNIFTKFIIFFIIYLKPTNVMPKS